MIKILKLNFHSGGEIIKVVPAKNKRHDFHTFVMVNLKALSKTII
jgi:hypothetical protein